jgi:hypothetical protein
MGLGDAARARAAASRAAAAGVTLDAQLLLAIERLENGAQ